MAGLAVYVFLLENLPGFENILNSTLHDMSNDNFINASVSECDPVLGKMIWQNINRKKIKPEFKLKYEDNYVDSLLPDDISANINSNKIEPDTEEGVDLKNSTFLVAIFESFSNITAQTCGGTLVSPHWVLTAATCVDLLSNLYENKNSNILDSHYYSIVANAVNPLIDGTVHNVTEIIFQPKYHIKSEMITKSPLDLRSGIKIPSLALLRIEPPVNETFIGIASETLKPGDRVDIYSWGLTKVELLLLSTSFNKRWRIIEFVNTFQNSTTKQDTMTVTTFEAITLESNDCKVNYSFIEDNSLICLSVFDAPYLETYQMNSGGPVVFSVGNKLLMAAVAQLDSHSKFIGYLLHPYYSWILEVISK